MKHALTLILVSLGLSAFAQRSATSANRTGKAVAVRLDSVKFICESCTGRMKMQVSGNDVSIIREQYPDFREKPTLFPLTLTLKPGEYLLMYWQNKVMQIQETFTVKAGETNEVRIK